MNTETEKNLQLRCDQLMLALVEETKRADAAEAELEIYRAINEAIISDSKPRRSPLAQLKRQV